MKITALMENMCTKRGLQGEHGLSFWIEHEGLRILFDSGQTGTFLENADSLGIDLQSLDAVVLSHGHYDHTGGLVPLGLRLMKGRGFRSPDDEAVPAPDAAVQSGSVLTGSVPESEAAAKAASGADRTEGSPDSLPVLYAGPGFDQPRSSSSSPTREVGIPEAAQVRKLFRVQRVDDRVDLGQDFSILRGAGDGLTAGLRFIRSENGQVMPDRFEDELTLVLRAAAGLVVITGCAHRGVLSILDSVADLFPGEPVLALVGGLHLVDMDNEEITTVAAALAAKNVARIYCDHCTGTAGFAALVAAMPGRVSWFSCGSRLEFS